MKTLLLTALAILGLLSDASANSILLGTVDPGSPSDDTAETARLNYFITSYNSGSYSPTPPATSVVIPNPVGIDNINNPHTYTLYFAGLPVVLPNPAAFISKEDQNPSLTVTLNAATMYVMAKFQNKAAYYYTGGFVGTVTLQSPFGTDAGALSHVSFFSAPPPSVPDGGATAAFLGFGILSVTFMARRFRMA